MRFRIGTILWAFALLAAALTTFDLLGILATALVLSLWSITLKKPGFILAEYLVVAALVGTLLLGILVKSLPIAHESARLNRCKSNLELIGAATKYDKFMRSLPYNWRSHLLPYLSIVEDNWRSQKDVTRQSSRPLSSIASDTFQCPCDNCGRSKFTSYLAIAGPTSRRSDKAVQRPHEISDGPSSTIVVIEAHNQDVAWTDSKDLSFDEAVDLLSNPTRQTNSCHWHEGGLLKKSVWVRNVLFADGTVRSLKMPLPTRLAMALLTADGGEQIDMLQLERLSKPELDYRKVYSLSVLVMLSLLPISNLRRQPKKFKTARSLRLPRADVEDLC